MYEILIAFYLFLAWFQVYFIFLVLLPLFYYFAFYFLA